VAGVAVSAANDSCRVKERLDDLRRRIADAGKDPGKVTIVGVTKTFGPEVVRAASEAGLRDLGENYASELTTKAETAAAEGLDLRWHFVGSIQRNKVRSVAPHVHLWQGVTRAAEGAEIARWSPGAAVLVQVNVSREATKSGVSLSEVEPLVARLVEVGLDVRGLMGIAARGSAEAVRGEFHSLAEVARQLGLAELSMGMTEDLDMAVQEGATMIRVGRALFGPRPHRSGVRE
jgi:pyridoxal phosphate enzyme (YggS family)